MANFIGTTVSNEAIVKADKLKDLKKYLTTVTTAGEDGELIHLEEYQGKTVLTVYGYDFFSVQEVKDEENYEYTPVDEEDFFKAIAPFLETELIVQSIGNEKCRYVSGVEWKVTPGGKVEYNSLRFL